jgi:hypothetical protein
MKPIQKNSYPNAELFKYENARVQVVSLKTKDYGIEFKILSEETTPRAFHIVTKNKIVTTGLKLSKEAALSLMIGLQEQLRKDGVI